MSVQHERFWSHNSYADQMPEEAQALHSALCGSRLLACLKDSNLPLRCRLDTPTGINCWVLWNRSSRAPRFQSFTAKLMSRRFQKHLFAMILRPIRRNYLQRRQAKALKPCWRRLQMHCPSLRSPRALTRNELVLFGLSLILSGSRLLAGQTNLPPSALRAWNLESGN